MKNREVQTAVLFSAVILLSAFLLGTILFCIPAGILSFVTGAVIFMLFIFHTKKRYRYITDLNDYLVRVLAGAEAPEIETMEEGELSILRTNLYKAATMLKTPLTSMMVMNDLLLDETDEARREELLRTQSAQLDRMNWLIQTLLKISKLDAGTIMLKQQEVPVSGLIEEALKPFLVVIDVKNIACQKEVSGETMTCDFNWTVEALQNIIKNCIEHMDEGGTLAIRAGDTTLYSQITIKDNGCGIPADDLPHIFERFYKGKNAGKDSVGIGLALAMRILEGEHGEITAESTAGVGTTFIIRIYKTII